MIDRRNFLKAAVAFCVAPIAFVHLKRLPKSFILSRTCNAQEARAISKKSLGCLNSKPYRGYPAETLQFICSSWDAGYMQTQFYTAFRKLSRSDSDALRRIYNSVDFNLIDFGEEVEG